MIRGRHDIAHRIFVSACSASLELRMVSLSKLYHQQVMHQHKDQIAFSFFSFCGRVQKMSFGLQVTWMN